MIRAEADQNNKKTCSWLAGSGPSDAEVTSGASTSPPEGCLDLIPVVTGVAPDPPEAAVIFKAASEF